MSRTDYSKKILKILSEKPALSISELTERVLGTKEEKKAVYALSRSIKGLQDTGLIHQTSSGQRDYARLTNLGRKKASSQKLDASSSVYDPTWDGKWRVILLDVPESRKEERDALRYLLKKAGFACLKNAVWISPLPYEHFFASLKKDFAFSTELMIFVTDTVDKETEKMFFSLGKK